LARTALTEEVSDKKVTIVFENLSPLDVSSAAQTTLTIPALGLVQVPVEMENFHSPNKLTLRFHRLSTGQHRALIALLYCRPGQWDERGVSESLTFWHFFDSLFRMYPLAEAK
jgi:hypothetical protein